MTKKQPATRRKKLVRNGHTVTNTTRTSVVREAPTVEENWVDIVQQKHQGRRKPKWASQ